MAPFLDVATNELVDSVSLPVNATTASELFSVAPSLTSKVGILLRRNKTSD